MRRFAERASWPTDITTTARRQFLTSLPRGRGDLAPADQERGYWIRVRYDGDLDGDGLGDGTDNCPGASNASLTINFVGFAQLNDGFDPFANFGMRGGGRRNVGNRIHNGSLAIDGLVAYRKAEGQNQLEKWGTEINNTRNISQSYTTSGQFASTRFSHYRTRI